MRGLSASLRGVTHLSDEAAGAVRVAAVRVFVLLIIVMTVALDLLPTSTPIRLFINEQKKNSIIFKSPV